MPPHTPQFTPAQVVQAGRRAEKDGKPDLAAHFYRHVVEHYGASPEAAEAREGLTRLIARPSGDVATPTPPPSPPETGHEASPAPQPPALEPQPAITALAIGRHSPTTRSRYTAGRFFAGLIVVMGWLTLASGLLLLAVAVTGKSTAWLPTWAASPAALVPTLGWATVQGLGGLVLILTGQVARAIFDIAETSIPDDQVS